MRGSWGGGHAWWQGACMVTGEVCMVVGGRYGGRGACMAGGHAWWQGGMRGGGGGMHGGGGHVWDTTRCGQ